MKLTNYRSFYNNQRLMVFTTDDIDKMTFDFNNATYMFAKRNNEFEVRKLSSTYNANVIFDIKLKEGFQGLSNAEFINILKNGSY